MSLLTQQQQDEVIEYTELKIAHAATILKKSYPNIPIKFDLTGRTIGMYKSWQAGQVIRYNPTIFAKYFSDNLKNTVPHEVAHYIVDKHYGRQATRPHGREWLSLVIALGGDGKRTAQYDLSGVAVRRYSTVRYTCNCQVHELGIRRHNKVTRGLATYACRQCAGQLIQV